jgi:hypothetical protein
MITQTKKFYSTEELASLLCIKADTVRRGLCVKGHYLGIKPFKLSENGRLLWPVSDTQKIFDRQE